MLVEIRSEGAAHSQWLQPSLEAPLPVWPVERCQVIAGLAGRALGYIAEPPHRSSLVVGLVGGQPPLGMAISVCVIRKQDLDTNHSGLVVLDYVVSQVAGVVRAENGNLTHRPGLGGGELGQDSGTPAAPEAEAGGTPWLPWAIGGGAAGVLLLGVALFLLLRGRG